jgi:hypothetical protein
MLTDITKTLILIFSVDVLTMPKHGHRDDLVTCMHLVKLLSMAAIQKLCAAGNNVQHILSLLELPVIHNSDLI